METTIFNQNTPLGKKTKELLKKKKIKSPSISKMIKIKEGLYVVPSKPIKTQAQMDAFIEKWEKIASINLNKIRKGGISSMMK